MFYWWQTKLMYLLTVLGDDDEGNVIYICYNNVHNQMVCQGQFIYPIYTCVVFYF